MQTVSQPRAGAEVAAACRLHHSEIYSPGYNRARTRNIAGRPRARASAKLSRASTHGRGAGARRRRLEMRPKRRRALRADGAKARWRFFGGGARGSGGERSKPARAAAAGEAGFAGQWKRCAGVNGMSD